MNRLLLILFTVCWLSVSGQTSKNTSDNVPYWEIDTSPGVAKPLVIYMHGYRSYSGGRWILPNSLDQIKNQGPISVNADGTLKYPSPPALIICPLLSSGSYSNDWINKLLDYCTSSYNITDIYLTGWSYGGGAVWDYISQAIPKYNVRGAAPIAGGYNTVSKAVNVKCKVWAFHGNADDVVPLSRTQSMYDAITCEKKLTVFEANHNISPWPFATSGFWENKPYTADRIVNLYTWLFEGSEPIDPDPIPATKQLYINGNAVCPWPDLGIQSIEVK